MTIHRDDIERRDLLRNSLHAAWLGSLGTSALGAGFLASPKRASAGVDGNSYILEAVAPKNIDSVMLWTDVILQHIRDAGMPPKVAGRAMAMGLLSGFLAMNGIKRRYYDNFNIGAGPAGADPIAAYHVATGIALEQAFNEPFGHITRRFLARVPAGQAKTDGIRYGRAVGKQIARWRVKDGSDDTKAPYYRGRYKKRKGVMFWEPTLPHFNSGVGPRLPAYHHALLPSWGYVKPFGVRDITNYRAAPFTNVRDPRFAADYEKIRVLGASRSPVRTADQSEIAFFWEDGPPGATPPGHFLLIAAQLFAGRFDTYELARNMALVAMASADAGIAAWDSKYHYDIVRPETAIRERASKLGVNDPRLRENPNWSSLILTPPFPAYTSGHSTFGAAGMRMIWNCIGTNNVSYTLRPADLAWWPEQLKGVTRRFTSLWQAAEENGLSRLYGGVHWTPDHTEGMRVGREISDQIFNNFFTAVG